MVAAAAVERPERCLSAVCEMVVMSKAVACKGEPDAVGACGWSGSWGRMWLSACSGQCPCPKRAGAVAVAAGSDSSSTAAIGRP